MQPTNQGRLSKTRLWTGRVLTILSVLFMLFDSVIHLMKPAVVTEAFVHLGYPDSLAPPLGIVGLFCVFLYALPRTSVLGAILLTGYLGGAVASHVRVGDPLFNIIFPVIIGTFIWGGLFLRDPRLPALFSVGDPG